MNTTNDGNNNNDDINNPRNNNNNQNEHGKKGKGRKKISIEKIEKEPNRQVTFSKRRAGVFKKASELSTLSGAEMASVVFSPGNKPYSFGHPSVESVADRFMNNSGGSMQGNAADYLRMSRGDEANQNLFAKDAEIQRERQTKKKFGEIAKANEPLEQVNHEQLEHLSVEQLEDMHYYNNASYRSGIEAYKPNNAGESSSQPNQGLGFPANMDPTVSGSGTTDEDPNDLPLGSPDHGTGFGGNFGH